MLFDEAVDGSLKINDGVEHTVFQAPPGQLGKEPLDSIEPGVGRWHEVEGPARMAASLRLPPSRIDATANNHRTCSASPHFRAKRRRSDAE